MKAQGRLKWQKGGSDGSMGDMVTQMRIWWLKGMWSLKEICDDSIRSVAYKGGGGGTSAPRRMWCQSG